MTGHKNIYNFREKWSSPPFTSLYYHILIGDDVLHLIIHLYIITVIGDDVLHLIIHLYSITFS